MNPTKLRLSCIRLRWAPFAVFGLVLAAAIFVVCGGHILSLPCIPPAPSAGSLATGGGMRGLAVPRLVLIVAYASAGPQNA